MFEVVTSPCCRRKDTVPLVVGVQCRVVGWPTVKVYPSLGTLKGLSVLEADTTAAKTAMAKLVKARILINWGIRIRGGGDFKVEGQGLWEFIKSEHTTTRDDGLKEM